MNEISGYWNIYHCATCATDFAISQETDDVDNVYCPHCYEHNGRTGEVGFTATDFIERTKEG